MSTLQERLRDGEMSPALWDKAADRLDALEREVEALRADAERYRYLRDAKRRECLTMRGPEAGVWCDAEDADGNLVLVTEDDLDAAIDAARSKT